MDSKLAKPIGDYFPEFEIGIDNPMSKGYLCTNISVFDHWMSESEAASCTLMCFSEAVKHGALDEYNDGEQKFLKLYKALAFDGVACNSPGPTRLIDGNDPQLEKIFIESLREQRFMDIYFFSVRARIIGRYDRTDVALLESAGDLNVMQARVESVGLFLLD